MSNNQLPNPNPYQVLDVSPSASKGEITKAFAIAMKRKKYPPDIIARARKALMNEKERLIADYLHPVLPPIQRFKRQDFSELERPMPVVEMIPEFDDLRGAIAAENQSGDADKKLGKKIFSNCQLEI
ncbi:molecular chaperone DnaJ [Lyngbya sp. CCY1209]|jgi:curved DNA-binding protein CbpA|uniref:molecular chaperone DnaJ n=1 Tax=Lyngbya sp. CCY1209 TaxID=2886103 RepID=UPI002D1FC5BF|nr:molecular chaperone DnaJ [Lyngbya sp. CCY1209]MEB3886228.1 molecular chaperone DnaJ [Lyngbya sp. CCY1209]